MNHFDVGFVVGFDVCVVGIGVIGCGVDAVVVCFVFGGFGFRRGGLVFWYWHWHWHRCGIGIGMGIVFAIAR